MHIPLGNVKTICAWASGSSCFGVAPIITLGWTIGDNSTKAGELANDSRLLRTQYSNVLFESLDAAANSRSVLPLFFHSSTLANIAADFDVFIIP